MFYKKQKEVKSMLRYTVWNKTEYVDIFDTYKQAREYVDYQFNQYGIKLTIHRDRA